VASGWPKRSFGHRAANSWAVCGPARFGPQLVARLRCDLHPLTSTVLRSRREPGDELSRVVLPLPCHDNGVGLPGSEGERQVVQHGALASRVPEADVRNSTAPVLTSGVTGSGGSAMAARCRSPCWMRCALVTARGSRRRAVIPMPTYSRNLQDVQQERDQVADRHLPARYQVSADQTTPTLDRL